MSVAISVIIPVYKSEKYLPKCIESVLQQSFADFELILVDDGSPDTCPKICDEYAEKDSRIKVIHKENGGVSSARNVGLEIAKGEYITFIDSDDYVDENFFEQAYIQTNNKDIQLFVSGLVMEQWKNGAKTQMNCFSPKNDFTYGSKQLLEAWGTDIPLICLCGPCCKLYKACIIREYNIKFNRSMDLGEDTWFNLDYIKHVEKTYVIQKCFYHYRRENAESLYTRFHKNIYEVNAMVYGKIRDLLIEFDCSQESKYRNENTYFEALIGGIHEYYRHRDKTTKQEKLVLLKKIANDQNVKKYNLSVIKGNKKKVLLILLKMRLYWIISFVFAWIVK